jgi:ribosome-associated toxin RatA of RatAB toxin-antitoxin module
MIYIKKIINQDLERTPTFNVESIRDFFKINLDNGQHLLKKIILIPSNEEFDVKFQKRETRDEYRVFLNELFQKINPAEGDILILRKRNQDVFLCEHINSNNRSYDHLNHLFEERNNHQLIINDIDNDNNENPSQPINLLDEFVSWFIKLDGVKHNYFTDSFSKNKEKLKAELIIYEEIYENEFKTKVFTTFTSEINNLIEAIKVNIEKKEGNFFEYSAKKSNHMPRAILGKNNYLKFLKEISNKTSINQIEFNIESFKKTTKEAGLIFSSQLIQRFVASLCTKPFVICSGLSGSGKTKLAQAFVQWICYKEEDGEKNEQYCIVPVGADWTNREPLLGYPNALNKEEYVSPENGVLDLMVRAKQNIENSEEPTKPYFLILDEMNLSHVERYFADFLSTMESGDTIPLHKILPEPTKDLITIPQTLKLPKNLFIIGTVNIDETTYMFSPKVLDRANTIEFRLTEKDLADFIASDTKLDMDLLKAQGANMSAGFMGMALKETDKNLKPSEADLKLFFSELKKSGAEFGYRTASEIGRLMYMLKELGESGDNLLDIAIMQKLLPKLHGSRSKLNTALTTLAKFCVKDAVKDFDGKDEDFRKTYFIPFDKLPTDSLDKIKYKISFEKISRMHKNAMENGFTSYAEA